MNKKSDKPRYTVLKVIAAAAAVFAVLAAASFPMKTVYYTVYTDKVTENVRIAQVSDLHSESYGKDMSALLEAIDSASPDIIALTGDIYDDIVNNDNTRAFLKAAAKKYPCFYIAGNHEDKRGEWKKYRLEAESFGVKVLEGDNINIKGITVCGAAKSADRKTGFDDSVEKCAGNAGDGFNVLLAHYPEKIGYYRTFGSFDLILSGHAHGGHWRIPFIVNGIYAPAEGLFPKYAGGLYDFEDCTMIVSRGLSRTKNKIPRIFNNPELVIIDIAPESEETVTE